MVWHPWTLLAALASAPAAPAQQAADRDAGMLIVSVNDEVVAREQFSLRAGRTAARDGLTLVVRRFPAGGGEAALVSTLEVGPDSQPAAAQFAEAGGSRTYVLTTPRRITVRAVQPAGESVREYPGAEHLWLVDDWALSWLALPPGRRGPTVTVLWPRADRREVLEWTDRGMARTAVGTRAMTLRHFVLGTGDTAWNVWFDERDRLVKVEIPSQHLVAVRAP